MTGRLAFALLFPALLLSRLAHGRILWVEEAYPAAAAVQMLAGKVPYRDFVFDKPPLSAVLYLVWGAYGGWPLRAAGALFAILVCGLLWRFADDMWGRKEAWLAAALLAFFLTFDLPSAAMALAPDLLMMAPHVAAVWLAWSGLPFWSGLLAGVALLVHTKGLIVLAACLLFQWRSAGRVVAGFLAPNAVALGGLACVGALAPYLEQVWWWGVRYARDPFVANAAWEGVVRTANWAGFHAALVVGAAGFWRAQRSEDSRRLLGWALLCLASVAAGWRFFPRYYFALLPVMTLAAARGLALLDRRRAALAMVLLAAPLARFGPRYLELAWDLWAGREHRWADLAMHQDSRRAAELVRKQARQGDTLLVWGYRPDVFALTQMPAGTPFLDSQPLTGVLADRHLVSSRPTFGELAARNRRRLAATAPSIIVDGLGPYNPALAIASYQDLGEWLAKYKVVGRTDGSVVYQRRRPPGGMATSPPSTPAASRETP